jgi:hypothetical protein
MNPARQDLSTSLEMTESDASLSGGDGPLTGDDGSLPGGDDSLTGCDSPLSFRLERSENGEISEVKLSDDVAVVKGVGEAVAKGLRQLGIKTVFDLVDYLPTRYEDYSEVSSIANLQPGAVTIKGHGETSHWPLCPPRYAHNRSCGKRRNRQRNASRGLTSHTERRRSKRARSITYLARTN